MDQDCVDAAAISGTQNSKAIKREWEVQMFRCLSSQNPLMCDEEDRMRTFPSSWCNQERPTPREMVDAGFYFKVLATVFFVFIVVEVCFTGNCMTIFWYENAKWFPMCQFVLKKQGVNYVEKVCQKHSNLHRPDINNPTRSIAANRLRSTVCCFTKCETPRQQSKKIKD